MFSESKKRSIFIDKDKELGANKKNGKTSDC